MLFLFLTVTDVNPATMPPPSNHSFPSPGPPATPPSPPLQTTNQNPSSTKFPGGTKPTLPTIPNPPAYTGPSKAGEYEASHLWNLISDMIVKILIFFLLYLFNMSRQRNRYMYLVPVLVVDIILYNQ